MTADYDIPVARSEMKWHTSSYSGGQGNCVQAALEAEGGVVPVRDSKRPGTPALRFNRQAWTAFLDQLR